MATLPQETRLEHGENAIGGSLTRAARILIIDGFRLSEPALHARRARLAEHYHAQAPFLPPTGQARSNVTIDINQRRQLCRIRRCLHFECLRENERSQPRPDRFETLKPLPPHLLAASSALRTSSNKRRSASSWSHSMQVRMRQSCSVESRIGEPTCNADVQCIQVIGSDMDDYRDLVIAGLFLACTGAALLAGLLYIEYGAHRNGFLLQQASVSSSLPAASSGGRKSDAAN